MKLGLLQLLSIITNKSDLLSLNIFRLPEMTEPQQQHQPNRAKKPSFFSFGRKKKSDPDSYRTSETETSGVDEPKGPPR